MALLRFGIDSSVQLDFGDGVVPDEYGVPRGDPLADPVESTRAAIDHPIDYPSLALSTAPGDRVVVTVERSATQVEYVVASAVNGLVAAGIDPDGISILLGRPNRETDVPDPCRLIAAAVRHRITEILHDPTDRKELAYLAANEDGEAILVNRALHEADFVLPIGCLRPVAAPGYFGMHGSLFPTFSDIKTQQRFRSLGSLNAENGLKQALVREVDQVAMQLGVYFSIQLVPGAGDRLLHVLAGQSDVVRKRGQSLYDAAWKSTAPRRAALVLAAIEGGPEQQTWENVAHAIEAASNLCEDGGAVAVCCELADRPGPALQRLGAESSRDAALRQIGKERPVDTIPAAQIAHALDRNQIYLYSQLDPSAVEDLDMVPIAGVEELVRLAHQHGSCAVLSNAPYASVELEESAL